MFPLHTFSCCPAEPMGADVSRTKEPIGFLNECVQITQTQVLKGCLKQRTRFESKNSNLTTKAQSGYCCCPTGPAQRRAKN